MIINANVCTTIYHDIFLIVSHIYIYTWHNHIYIYIHTHEHMLSSTLHKKRTCWSERERKSWCIKKK